MKDYINSAYSKLRFKCLAPILLEMKQLNYSIIKGEVLSVQAYGGEGYRHSSDVDILIPYGLIPDVENILMFYGFKSVCDVKSNRIKKMISSHQTIPWKKEDSIFGATLVDINYDVFWGEYEGPRIDMDDFLSDSVEIKLYGLKVKAPSPIKSLIHLVLHHYKDMNSIFLLATKNSIKFEMFQDVYYLLKNNLDKISVKDLYKLSYDYQIIPFVFYVLYYTGCLFEDDMMKEYIESFRTPEGERLLNLYGLCEKERRKWKVDFATRLNTNNIFRLIEADLSPRDLKKIELNKQIFSQNS